MNKEDKQGYIVILCVLAITGLIVIQIVECIKNRERTYEYAKNGEIGVSSNCYLKDDVAFCEKDNIKIIVDNYYIRKD